MLSTFEKVSQKRFAEITGMPIATQSYRRSVKPESLPPSYKLGKCVYYNYPDVMAWIESCRREN